MHFSITDPKVCPIAIEYQLQGMENISSFLPMLVCSKHGPMLLVSREKSKPPQRVENAVFGQDGRSYEFTTEFEQMEEYTEDSKSFESTLDDGSCVYLTRIDEEWEEEQIEMGLGEEGEEEEEDDDEEEDNEEEEDAIV